MVLAHQHMLQKLLNLLAGGKVVFHPPNLVEPSLLKGMQGKSLLDLKDLGALITLGTIVVASALANIIMVQSDIQIDGSFMEAD